MKKRGRILLPAEQRQLSVILRELQVRVPDSDDYGSLIGDVIFDALSDFKFLSSSQEERRLKEVKQVYLGFETLNEQIESNRGYYQPLLLIQGRVEKLLSQMREKFPQIPKEIEPMLEAGTFKGSVLFYHLSDTLINRMGNPLDKLRRYGIGLDSLVRERGVVTGNRNCMIRDYQDISQSFVRFRGDRRE